LYPANGIPGIYYCNGSSVPKGLISPPKINIDLDIVSGASMSFRKSILNEVGGFSPFFNGYGQGEDLEISLRVKRISKIVLLSNAKCNHYHTPSSRPNLSKKGFMEVFNRYYIWHFNVPNKKFKCRIQFWGDIFLLKIYALSLYIKSGFKLIYLQYFIGYWKGTVTCFRSRLLSEIKRDLFYSIDRNE
jgi:GT2 family glycosyltransferase